MPEEKKTPLEKVHAVLHEHHARLVTRTDVTDIAVLEVWSHGNRTVIVQVFEGKWVNVFGNLNKSALISKEEECLKDYLDEA